MLKIKLILYLITIHVSFFCQGQSEQLRQLEWQNNIDFGCCNNVAPLDMGQIFNGHRFLVWQDAVYIYDFKNNEKSTKYEWALNKLQPLPGKIISAGVERNRVKWRENKLWVKGKSKIFRHENPLKPKENWFPSANIVKSYNDFEPTFYNNIYLIATSDLKNSKPGALIELLDVEKNEYKIGSSRFTGEGGLDLEEEVVVIAEAVGHALEDLDLVVHALQH